MTDIINEKDLLRGTLYPKEEKYLEIFMNPDKYYQDERKLCDLINEVLEDSSFLYNELSREAKANVNQIYGKFDKKCFLKNIGELTTLKVFASHLVISNEEKLVKLIERYFYIKKLLGFSVKGLTEKAKEKEKEEDEIDDEEELEIPKENNVLKAIDAYIDSFTLERLLKKPIFFRNKKIDEIKIVDEIQNIFSNNFKGLVFEDRFLLDKRRADEPDVLEAFQQKKLFYDKMTDLTSKEIIFNDAEQQTLFNFQYLINNFFNKFISAYLIKNKYDLSSIIFLYKGGTTMKIIYEKYKQLYGDNEFFKKEVAAFFSRSDSDYQIFINKVIFNEMDSGYIPVFYDMSVLTFNILYYIKRFLNEYVKANEILPLNLVTEPILAQKLDSINKLIVDDRTSGKNELTLFKNVDKFIGLSFSGKDYFSEPIPEGFIYTSIEDFGKGKSWHEENDEDRDPILFKRNKKYKYKINLEGTKLNKKQQFIKYKKVSPDRKDFFITSVKHDTTVGPRHFPKLVRLNNSNSDNGLFMYVNETNTFLAYTKEIFSFNLFRIKINAVAYYKTLDGKYGFINIPSELVDISICKGNDYKTDPKNIRFDTEFKQYVNDLNGKTVTFYSYSLIGFINDIYKALFTENQYPWDDPKYEKKINRVITLLLIYLNNRFENITSFLQELKNFVDNPNNTIFNIFIFTKDLKKLMPISSIEEIHKFLDALGKIIKLRDTVDIKTQQKIDVMKNIIKNLIDKFELKDINSGSEFDVEKVPYLEKYLTSENSEPIQNNKSNQSKYYKKYLKYKSKYNQLKNNLE